MNRNNIKDELTSKDYEKIEPKLKEIDEKIEDYIKERIPEYRKSSMECQHVIDVLENCLTKYAIMSSICHSEQQEVYKCTQKYLCPKEYVNWLFCMSRDKRKCRPFQLKLDDCLSAISDRIDAISKDFASK